jgi:hypothetical protein
MIDRVLLTNASVRAWLPPERLRVYALPPGDPPLPPPSQLEPELVVTCVWCAGFAIHFLIGLSVLVARPDDSTLSKGLLTIACVWCVFRLRDPLSDRSVGACGASAAEPRASGRAHGTLPLPRTELTRRKPDGALIGVAGAVRVGVSP